MHTPYQKETWESILSGFAKAPLHLIEGRSLLRRTDTKFVLEENTALEVLCSLQNDYMVLPAGEALAATYRTLYFDTEHLDFFHAHRRGKRLRHKVRIRHYPDRNVGFLEIKKRISQFQQVKLREERPFGDTTLTEHDTTFIRKHTGEAGELYPQAWMDFKRITLLSTSSNERVTIDFGLALATSSKTIKITGLVILEIKQWPFCRRTTIMQALKAKRCRLHRFSKYCAATILTHPGIRSNRLTPRLRILKGYIV